MTDNDTVTVASFDFAESSLVAELYSQALEAGGIGVERAYGIGPREFVEPALMRGLVELVPEYAGTALEFVTLGRTTPSGDADRTHDALVQALGAGTVTALSAAPAQTANAFVMTAEAVQRYGVRTLTDLASVADRLVFGGPPECAARPFCLLGLQETYGITFHEVVRLDVGGPATRQALSAGAIDVGLLFTTDPALREGAFVALEDDRHLQPAENITPLVRTETLSRFGPGFEAIVDSVSRHLTTAELGRLNAELAAADGDMADVAHRWLTVKRP